MVAAALIVLVQLGRAEAYLAIIIIGREIADLGAARMDGADRPLAQAWRVAFIGKVKTVAQMTAIIALLLWEPRDSRHLDARAGDDRAVGRRDPDALVDVPLPAPRGAALRGRAVVAPTQQARPARSSARAAAAIAQDAASQTH